MKQINPFEGFWKTSSPVSPKIGGWGAKFAILYTSLRISVLLGAFVALAGCQPAVQKADIPPPVSDVPTTPAPRSPEQLAPSGSAEAQFLPNPQITPGDVFDVTADDVCVSGYSKRVRNVPARVKKEAYAEYGITSHEPGEYEVDHLISLELGGSNSIKNLWPQSYLTEPWNAHEKDKLENRLHKLVCDGKMELKTAQQIIATDWIAGYRKYISPHAPKEVSQ